MSKNLEQKIQTQKTASKNKHRKPNRKRDEEDR